MTKFDRPEPVPTMRPIRDDDPNRVLDTHLGTQGHRVSAVIDRSIDDDDPGYRSGRFKDRF